MHYKELKETWAELPAPGAPGEVAAVEVRGQHLRTFAAAPRNVRELWLSTAPFADRDYLIYQDERVSYGQAHATVGAIACWLRDQGVRQGDRVAIAMRNYPEWMLIYWACVCTGVAVVGMNAWWVAEEMAYGLKDGAPKVVFCDGERLQRLFERPLPEPAPLVVVVRAGSDRAGVIPWSEVVAKPGADLDRDEIMDFLRGRGLSPWGLPDDIVFIDELPKTSVGKFSKRDLRDKFSDYRPTSA